jgi:hypothetical protein
MITFKDIVEIVQQILIINGCEISLYDSIVLIDDINTVPEILFGFVPTDSERIKVVKSFRVVQRPLMSLSHFVQPECRDWIGFDLKIQIKSISKSYGQSGHCKSLANPTQGSQKNRCRFTGTCVKRVA